MSVLIAVDVVKCLSVESCGSKASKMDALLKFILEVDKSAQILLIIEPSVAPFDTGLSSLIIELERKVAYTSILVEKNSLQYCFDIYKISQLVTPSAMGILNSPSCSIQLFPSKEVICLSDMAIGSASADLCAFFTLVGDKAGGLKGVRGFGVSNTKRLLAKNSFEELLELSKTSNSALMLELNSVLQRAKDDYDNLVSQYPRSVSVTVTNNNENKVVDKLIDTGALQLDKNATLVDNNEKLIELISNIKTKQSAFIDFNGSSLVRWLAVSFEKDSECYLLPLTGFTQKIKQLDLEQLFGVLSRSSLIKVTSSSKDFYTIWRQYTDLDISLFGDVQLLSYLIDPINNRKKSALEIIGEKSGDANSDLHMLLSMKRNLAGYTSSIARNFNRSVLNIAKYKLAFRNYYGKVHADSGLLSYYQDIELAVSKILVEVESTGLGVDFASLGEFKKRIDGEVLSISEEIFKLSGCEFNLNSGTEIKEKLFKPLHIPFGKDDGVNAEFLSYLSGNGYDVADKISKYRNLLSINVAINGLIANRSTITDRVHCTINQNTTKTGRLSTTSPNLQGIPVKTALGRELRDKVVARKGYSIVAADYSQIELRLLAHFSGDEFLINAFVSGVDIHSATASQIFGIELDQVTSEQRRPAKSINFGIIYGISPKGLASMCGSTEAEALSFIHGYFNALPTVKKYINKLKSDGLRNRYAETLVGRRIYANNAESRSSIERAMVNAPMQGSGSDIVKLAMVSVTEVLKSKNIDAKILLQVHDELVFEVKDEDLDRAMPIIKDTLENVVSLKVPLEVSIESAHSWSEAH